jgi:hypothetical protein
LKTEICVHDNLAVGSIASQGDRAREQVECEIQDENGNNVSRIGSDRPAEEGSHSEERATGKGRIVCVLEISAVDPDSEVAA